VHILRHLSSVFCLLLLSTTVIAANDKEIKLTSLEWPPYTGQKLTNQGATSAVVRQAFNAMGYSVVINFFPWTRAIKIAKDNPSYAGYFPEYHSANIASTFTYSNPIGVGPLGFAERSNKSVAWNTLDDLKDLKIGVVKDYVNTDEFDQKVANKQFKVDETLSDEKNLLKLHRGRIDLAVVDKNVFNYLLQTTPELIQAQKTLRFNQHILENKNLYICFKKDPQGERYAKIFNEGLKKINVADIMAQHGIQ
jgi:polar amino acid transport system substrate-binding protein